MLEKLGGIPCHRGREGTAERSQWLKVPPKRRPAGGALSLLGAERCGSGGLRVGLIHTKARCVCVCVWRLVGVGE